MSILDKIAAGSTDLVFEYLANGTKASDSDKNGVSLIKWCAYYGDVSAIRFLIANGESLKSLGENLDLNGAVFHGHWRLTQYLIENGADVNIPLPDTGETPLHNALCRINSPSAEIIVKLLLARGANPDFKTKNSVPTGSFMRDARTKAETPLHRAGDFGSEEVIELLLKAGEKIDAKDANNESPLSWASWHKRPAFILAKLCYGEFSIHSDAVAKSRKENFISRDSMEINLLGRPVE